ncbi:MAG: pyruvate dehydrogenase (acetyl-transferring) E1 component subunit alpha [Rickettsiales bacterium]
MAKAAAKKKSKSAPANVKKNAKAAPKKTLQTVVKSSTTTVPKEKLIKMFREMLLIRRFEEKAGQLYGMGLIGGFCHLYIGQEAVVTGIQAAGKPTDAVVTTYRDHAHMIACGMEPRGIMAELTGRIGGFSKGKGGSMHMFSVEKNFFGGHGIVGANVPLGTGMAFAQKYKGTKDITFTYFGDGASNQGQVYESFNMASLWNLPVIYIIENNEYAMGTSTQRHAADTHLYKRGEAFGIPGIKVNGMDVLEVYEAAKKVIEHVRSGKGPYLMEVKTYRYRGHSMSDPAKYRTKEEVEKYKEQRDALNNFREYLSKNKIASEADFKKIEDEVKAIVNDAAEFAKESPEPDATELWTDVLSKE